MHAASLGLAQRHLLLEVKSLHDLTARTRPWIIDYVLNHDEIAHEWSARSEWSRGR